MSRTIGPPRLGLKDTPSSNLYHRSRAANSPAFGTLLSPSRIWHQISRILTIGGCDQNHGRACSVYMYTYSFSTCMCTHICLVDIPISISMCQRLSSSSSFITYLVKKYRHRRRSRSEVEKGEGLATRYVLLEKRSKKGTRK